MGLQSSGAISLTQIATEFGGSAPHSLSEYYGVTTGVPTSGTITFSDFYGKSSVSITGDLLHTLDNPSAYGTTTGDYFGFSVSISGDYAIVGAYGENDADGNSSGKAYIFNVSTGALLHTLDNPNAYGTSSAGEYFGRPVSISGDYAIVGAYGEDDAGGTYSGKAYIFNVSTGALLHTLDNPSAY
jgi:hypothetical protein